MAEEEKDIAKDSGKQSGDNQEPVCQEISPESIQDEDIFANYVSEELGQRDIFAGDEKFHRMLASQSSKSGLSGRLSTVQKTLLAGIFVIAGSLVFLLVTPSEKIATSQEIAPQTDIAIIEEIKPEEQPPLDAQQVTAEIKVAPSETVPEISRIPQKTEPHTGSISLEVAQKFYQNTQYDKSYTVYELLLNSIADSEQQRLTREFLQLRMAMCMQMLGDFEKAGYLFKAVLETDSAALKVIANYNLAILNMHNGRFLDARNRAYQAIVIVDAVDFDEGWSVKLKNNCEFLIAEALTKRVFSLSDADKYFPKELWKTVEIDDPIAQVRQDELYSLLNSGKDTFDKAVLGPQFSKNNTANVLQQWTVISYRAPIEELISRFAANTQMNIHWHVSSAEDFVQTEKAILNRPSTVYLNQITAREAIINTAGSVGLIARVLKKTDGFDVHIYNPADYLSLSEHIKLVADQAADLWQKYLLTFPSDGRRANIHFAVGMLYAQRGLFPEAIAEYNIVANRFSNASLAPFALFSSSRIKTDLKDYAGARQDLKQLVDQYPDTEVSNQACISLADATMQAGLYEEAEKLYIKVYNIGWSRQVQSNAAFGAAKCFYTSDDFENTEKWISKYIELVKNDKTDDLYYAYFILGRAGLAIGKTQQACDAFNMALTGKLSREIYSETISSLIESKIQQEDFVGALNILESVQSWKVSQNLSFELLLLRSSCYRKMGLSDKAISIIGQKAEYVFDPILKAKAKLELARCRIDRGNFQDARDRLTEILILIEPGTFAHEVALDLALVYAELKQDLQAVSVCTQLLDMEPSESIKKQTFDIMAKIYKEQKNYDRAALVLMGIYKQDQSAKAKHSSDTAIAEAM